MRVGGHQQHPGQASGDQPAEKFSQPAPSSTENCGRQVPDTAGEGDADQALQQGGSDAVMLHGVADRDGAFRRATVGADGDNGVVRHRDESPVVECPPLTCVSSWRHSISASPSMCSGATVKNLR